MCAPHAVATLNTFTRAFLVMALTIVGSRDEAMTAANSLIEAAEAAGNPCALSYALLAYGLACDDTDPGPRTGRPAPGLTIAQDSGNRANESYLSQLLARLEAEHGDPLAELEYITVAIRNIHDLGNVAMIPSPLSTLAALLDRLGRHEAAATIAGFALN